MSSENISGWLHLALKKYICKQALLVFDEQRGGLYRPEGPPWMPWRRAVLSVSASSVMALWALEEVPMRLGRRRWTP